MNTEQQTIREIALEIKADGFRVFLSKKGTYGFYTNQKLDRVISFQLDFGSPVFSGNYITDQPKNTGTGWRITNIGDELNFKEIYDTVPPQWALEGANWRYASVKDHIHRYQKSSKYMEF